MKIATWNVNSLKVRLPQVLQWLESSPVDILCLQELKLTDDKFPFEALAAAGYAAQAFGQKTYNGVAILSKTPLTDVTKNIPGFEDEQSRVIAATLGQGDSRLRIINAYFVNGQEPGSDKFAYKLRWLQAMHAYIAQELQAHPNLVLVGDFNVTATDEDSWDPVGLKDTIHHTQEERDAFHALLALGLHDAFRAFAHPPQSFSWWDYRMLGFQKNRGLRIDYILVSDALRAQLQSCEIDRVPRKYPQPSDHTPVVADLLGG